MQKLTAPVLVVAYSDDACKLLQHNLEHLEVQPATCETFCQAEKLALEGCYNGILIDLPSIIKAKGEEKNVAYTLASVYPALRVRTLGKMLVPMAMPGDVKQDISLNDFICKSCAPFMPRRLRAHRRRNICISTVRLHAGADERGFTLNISWGGAFIADMHPERFTVGQELRLFFQEPGLKITATICWIQYWGHNRIPGVGVKFTEPGEALEKALFALMKHDRDHDPDRLSIK